MERVKLTKTVVDRFARSGEVGIAWDSEVPNFGARKQRPDGGVSFVAKYQFRKRTKFVTVGRLGKITVEQAREAARRLLAGATLGHDTVEERKVRSSIPTFQEASEAFLEAKTGKIADSTRGQYSDLLSRRLVPAFGTMHVDLSTPDRFSSGSRSNFPSRMPA